MSARTLDMLLDIEPGTAEALRQLCQLRILKEQVDAQIAQERMARELREGRAVNGLGELQMRIHGTGYHYWGQREGYDCWKDDGFRKDFLKRAPECKVKCGGTKSMVGWQAGQEGAIEIFGTGKAPRFRKTYEETTNNKHEI